MFLFHIRSFFSCVATYTRAGLFSYLQVSQIAISYIARHWWLSV
uniref:Uncharacterized protein n=1 Tax=Anguilla anguilla TaxID=7936 RepID=A0A0E9TML9_ANGAN